jgi:hypothetical protein
MMYAFCLLAKLAWLARLVQEADALLEPSAHWIELRKTTFLSELGLFRFVRKSLETFFAFTA